MMAPTNRAATENQLARATARAARCLPPAVLGAAGLLSERIHGLAMTVERDQNDVLAVELRSG
jgi:hypothetical protein